MKKNYIILYGIFLTRLLPFILRYIHIPFQETTFDTVLFIDKVSHERRKVQKAIFFFFCSTIHGTVLSHFYECIRFIEIS